MSQSVYKKMAVVMGELERIPKNGYNKEQRYNFASAEDIKDAARRAMAKHNLALVIELVDYEIVEVTARSGTVGTKLRGNLKFTLVCGDTGEVVVSIMPNEAIDWQDKAFSKLYTIGLKYFLINTFLISTGDEPDTDAGGTEQVVTHAKTKAARPPRPWQPGVLAEYMAGRVPELGGGDKPTPNRFKAAMAALNAVTNGKADHQHAIIARLFGQPSRGDLTAGQCEALIAWIGATPANEFQPSGVAIQEAAAFLEQPHDPDTDAAMA